MVFGFSTNACFVSFFLATAGLVVTGLAAGFVTLAAGFIAVFAAGLAVGLAAGFLAAGFAAALGLDGDFAAGFDATLEGDAGFTAGLASAFFFASTFFTAGLASTFLAGLGFSSSFFTSVFFYSRSGISWAASWIFSSAGSIFSSSEGSMLSIYFLISSAWRAFESSCSSERLDSWICSYSRPGGLIVWPGGAEDADDAGDASSSANCCSGADASSAFGVAGAFLATFFLSAAVFIFCSCAALRSASSFYWAICCS